MTAKTTRPEHTAESIRALLDERKPYAAAIMAAVLRGDLAAAAKAQDAMRDRFSD